MQNFSCSALLRCRLGYVPPPLTGLSPSVARFSNRFCSLGYVPSLTVLLPRRCRDTVGLGWCAFARHYSRNHFCFLFLRLLRCFSSPGLPGTWYHTIHWMVGCPIRKSMLRRVFAPGHGLSQLVTSFVASESQGILHVPFSPFLILSGVFCNACLRWVVVVLSTRVLRRHRYLTLALSSLSRARCCLS